MRGIAESIGNLANNIKEGLIDGLKGLFVPEEGYFDSKFQELTAKFAFWRSITDTIDVFKNFFENHNFNEPPTITVNLSSAQGDYDYGQSAMAIDLSWYEPYRDVVDAILSGILWLFFVWNTWNDLPNLINGVSTVAEIKEGQKHDN